MWVEECEDQIKQATLKNTSVKERERERWRAEVEHIRTGGKDLAKYKQKDRKKDIQTFEGH